jgi:hypothetical protein
MSSHDEEPKPVTDEYIQQHTGKTWGEWVTLIDSWTGEKRSIAAIAHHLSDHHHVRRLWAQAIAVYYRQKQLEQ